MKKLGFWVCILLMVGLLLPLAAGAVTVVSQEEADEALRGLTGTTVMEFQDYWDGVSKTNNDQITFEKVTGAAGQYSSYIRANVLSTNSSSTTRQLLYKNLSGIAAGDSVLLSFVMRSAGGAAGKGTVTLMAQNATSSANKSFTIPTEWTRIYIPLTAKDAATITTFRLNTLVQTVDIADYTVVNYGADVALDTLPSGSYTVAEEEVPSMEGLTGGTVIELTGDLYETAVQAAAGSNVTFAAPETVASGNMALLALDVKAQDVCAQMTVSFGGITKEYSVPVQWSRIYMPVQAASDLTGATVTVDTGTVLIAGAVLENKGSASFEDLSLKSGMWLLEEFQDVALDPASSGVGAGKTTDLVISPDGNYIYSIGGGSFTVTDVTDQANPTIVKQLTGFGDTRQIALCADGDGVIFTSRIYGAYIVDVSDPVNAYVRSHYDTLEMATGIATYKDYAFICSRFYGVEVVDISDLDNPVHKCIIRNGGEVQSVEVVDGYLYGGLYNTNQVEIYDVRDPVNYTRVGVADLNGRGDGVAVAKVGEKTYLYAGTGHHSVAGLATSTPLSDLNYGDGNGLDIFDVTDPSAPVWLSTSRIDGRFYHTSCDYWGAQVSYDETTGKYYAYLVSTYNGIYVFDVTDPAAPRRVAHVAVRIGTDSEYYKKPTSTRAIIFQYDPAVYVQSPAGAVACADGALFYAGVETDLHVLTADYAYAHVEKPAAAEITSDFDYYNYDAFEDLTGFAYADPEGQTASVALYGDKVYVSGGDQGILVYSQDLQTLHKVIGLDGCSYDVYIQDGKLYSAEGTAGFAVYTIGSDGVTLTEQTRYVSGCVTMARPSVTGKLVAIHSGATVGEIVDISGTTPERKIRAVATSQMYHHNVCNGIVGGRYVAFWANSSSERWYDLGENDSLDTPVLLSNIPSAGFTPKAAMTGGYTTYGSSQVLATGSGGYYVYDPASVTETSYKAMTVTKPVNAEGTKVNVYGKPAIYGDTLVLSDRIYGRLYILDIHDIENPVLLKAFENLPGNPDAAAFSLESIYIPMGYQGIIKLDLAANGADATRHYGGDHCACGGYAVGMSGHSCTDLSWTAWTDPDSLPTSGKYYLTTDVTVSIQTTITGKLNLCLNGHTITASGTDRVYTASSRELHITDCREENNWGTIYGGDVTSTYSGEGGAIFHGQNSTYRLYLYAGNFVGGTAARGGVAYAKGGQIHIYGGNLIGGTATNIGGSIYINAGAAGYMYGGTVKNGTSAGAAGNVFVNVKASFTMYGGTITGGQATTTGGNVNVSGGGSTAGYYGGTFRMEGGIISAGQAVTYGGNVYVGGMSSLCDGAQMEMTGGTITGGVVNNSANNTEEGGNIYLQGSLTMSDGTISDGDASNGYGGNVSVGNKNSGGVQYAVFTMSGGTISGGTARMGGSLDVKGVFTMTGGTINGGKATSTGGSIRIYRPGVVTIDGGTVYGGTASNGGAVGMFGADSTSMGTTDAVFILESGLVTGGTATNHGGNIAGQKYTQTVINGGTVSNGKVTKATGAKGGNIAVYENDSTFTMTGGAVSGGWVDPTADCGSYGGNVYLETSATISGGTITGGTAEKSGSIHVTEAAQLTISGGTITGGYARNGGNMVVYGSVTMIDGEISNGQAYYKGGNICVWQTSPGFTFAGGKICGGTAESYGGNVWISGYNDPASEGYEAAGVFTMTGGEISGGEAAAKGGNVYITNGMIVNISGGSITDGTSNLGGNIYIGLEGSTYVGQLDPVLNLSGKVTVDGADVDLYIDNTLLTETQTQLPQVTVTDWTGSYLRTYLAVPSENALLITVDAQYPGKVIALNEGYTAVYGDGSYILTAGAAAAVAVYDSSYLFANFTTLEEALAVIDSGAGTYIKLLADVDEKVTVTGELWIDLNGFKLSGITLEGTLYGMDSATNDYTDADAGSLSYSGSGTVATNCKTSTARCGGVYRYLTVANDDGTVSFHRFYMGVTKLSLKPATVGMGYKAVFAGSDRVKAQLAASQGYGYRLQVEDGPEVVRAYGKELFTSLDELTLRLDNILSDSYTDAENQANAQLNINARVFITLANGETITSSLYSYTFRDVVEAADAGFDTYTEAQKSAFAELVARFEGLMQTWQIPNTHHLDGWTAWNGTSTSGTYYLDRDLTLSGTVTVAEGTSLKLCLNGHTLSATARVFSVYGELTVCDCAGTGLITHSTSSTAIYVNPTGTLDMYGGTLTRTDTYSSNGGVVGIAGVMNLYGGTIRGGTTTGNGGNVMLAKLTSATVGGTLNMYGGAILDGAGGARGGNVYISNGTFNLYGGTVSGGTATGNGGNIYLLGTSSAANLYGGTVSDGSAQYGGNIYACANTPLKVDGATVTGGTAQYNGGNICMVNAGTFQVSGTVTDGTAGNDGGNIYIYRDMELFTDKPVLNLSGTVSGGKAGDFGGGVYAYGCQLNLLGKVVISGNEGSDLYLAAGQTVNTVDLDSASSVGVLTPVLPGYVSDDITYAACFFSNAQDYPIDTSTGDLQLGSSDAAPNVYSAGFATADITPKHPVALDGSGNYEERKAAFNVLENIYAQTVVISDGTGWEGTVVMCSMDALFVQQELAQNAALMIQAATGIPAGNVFFSASHSHMTPDNDNTDPDTKEYLEDLYVAMAQSVVDAVADMKGVSDMSIGSVETEGMTFMRRFLLKEGVTVKGKAQSNSDEITIENSTVISTVDFTISSQGLTAADILSREGEEDEMLQVLRIERPDGDDIVLMNFQVHPTFNNGGQGNVGPNVIGDIRNNVMASVDGVKAVYFTGATGNQTKSDDLASSNLNEVQYGEKMAQYVVDLLNGEMTSIGTGAVSVAHMDGQVVTSGKHPLGSGKTVELPLNAVSVGQFAFVTAPYEMFGTNGMQLKAYTADKYAMTFVLANCNGENKYIPSTEAFDYDLADNGELNTFEVRTCRFVQGTAETLVGYMQDLIDQLD